ncbi:GerAB/ArcD/ProY family transporter [Brevibacillus sp. SYSU BS000544]|uniref:GerAB/ArcD/ProY family transporter n=1 Tax=Brevibacillus sp. SYSU BS000544 TaxID=3416443 RepID=UPI003CE46058
MDRGKIKKLQPIHVIFLVQNSMVGVGLLSLPHDLSAAGYNQWILPAIFAVIAQLTLLSIYWLGRCYPDDTLFVINEKLLGKWLGKGISLFVIVYFMIQVATVTEGYLRLIQIVTLPYRTILGPMIVLYIAMVYIALGGIKTIARFCIIGFLMTGWMIYYLQWAMAKGHPIHLFPLFDLTLHDFFSSFKTGYAAMMGYELLLVYFPYVVNQKKVYKHASIGIWITAAFYVTVCFTSAIYFTRWQMDNLRFPVLNLFKAVELSFIERIENFGVSLWVFLILTTACSYLWAAQKGIETIVNRENRGILVACAIVSSLFILLPIPHEIKHRLYFEWNFYLGLCVVLYPTLLLLIHLFHRGRMRYRGTA